MNTPGSAPITSSPLMGTIAGVIVEPYKTFFAKLYAAGRVTHAEVTELRTACEEKMRRLAELVDKALEDAAKERAGRGSDGNYVVAKPSDG